MLGGSMEDGAYRPCTACARPGLSQRNPSRYCLGRLCDVTASAVPVMTRWATVFRSRARNRASTARLSQQANVAGGESLPWLCATADHWTAVRYGGPLVRGSLATASGGPFWAARASCGNVRTVLERSQAPLSSSKRVWHNSDIWPLSTCLN